MSMVIIKRQAPLGDVIEKGKVKTGKGKEVALQIVSRIKIIFHREFGNFIDL